MVGVNKARVQYQAFYSSVDRDLVYTSGNDPQEHPFFFLLQDFIERYRLKDKKCLEIGSSKGLFQDVVDDYTGIDIVDDLRSYYHKPYYKVSGAQLPFPDSSFDAIFAYTTHEHIPDLEMALKEIVRVLKPGGVCLFAPAWHTRPWFSKGYKVRPYSELALQEKFIKLTIPFRDSIFIRWPIVICRRIIRLSAYLLNGKRTNPLKYKKLNPNYEIFWHSDSDACNSIDPFDVILWFKSRGFACRGHEKLFTNLFVRTYALELQKPIT